MGDCCVDCFLNPDCAISVFSLDPSNGDQCLLITYPGNCTATDQYDNVVCTADPDDTAASGGLVYMNGNCGA